MSLCRFYNHYGIVAINYVNKIIISPCEINKLIRIYFNYINLF